MSSHHHHGQRLGLTIILNIGITLAQLIGGVISGSLALLSDAAHNFSDVIALIVSYIGHRLSKKTSSASKTFGFKRAEIIAALINVVSIMVIAVLLFLEAFQRLGTRQEISGDLVVLLGGLSILLNGLSVLLLHPKAKESLNMKSAYLHLFSDMLTSIAVVVGGLLMVYLHWYWVDMLISGAIALYLIVMSLKMLFETLSILMLFAPPFYKEEEVRLLIEAIPGVAGVHHIHAWQLTDQVYHFEGHILVREDMPLSAADQLKQEIKKALRVFGFQHVTLEVEVACFEAAGCRNKEEKEVSL